MRERIMNQTHSRSTHQATRHVVITALAAAVFVGAQFGLPSQAKGKNYTFQVHPDASSVDMTQFAASYWLTTTGTPWSTADTQTMRLGGTITLDVDIVGGAVTNVDFVSLEWACQVDLDNPTVFEKRTLYYSSLEQLNGGSLQHIRLPFDMDVAVGTIVGNDDAVLSPRLWLDAADAGTESGSGGSLRLEGSAYGFEGTGQYFFPELDRSVYPLRDGFPIQFGSYPQAVDFPSEIPLSVKTDGNGNVMLIDPDGDGNGDAMINETMSAPTGPNFLDGTVTLAGSVLTFEADFLSYGVGGAGIIKSALIHEGSVVATAVVPEPTGFALLGLMGLMFTCRRNR